MAHADRRASLQDISASLERGSARLAQPVGTKPKSASAERDWRPLEATMDRATRRLEHLTSFQREGYVRMHVYEKTTGISRWLQGFVPLRELLIFRRL